MVVVVMMVVPGGGGGGGVRVVLVVRPSLALEGEGEGVMSMVVLVVGVAVLEAGIECRVGESVHVSLARGHRQRLQNVEDHLPLRRADILQPLLHLLGRLRLQYVIHCLSCATQEVASMNQF